MEIGKKIKQLRCKASLTQEQLAERMGLSAQAVSKWENGVTMPDISLLPELAGLFGVSIDELFDLTAEQKMIRIENSLEMENDLPQDLFREYEDFLKSQLAADGDKQKATSLMAHLYHHRADTFARKAGSFAREAIRMAPGKKDCQWLLQKTEGATSWDWNASNHSATIAFYKELVEQDDAQSPSPYYYLLDNLLADRRVKEAKLYLARMKQLPGRREVLVPVYEAAIALAEYDEPRADAIMEKALADFAGNSALLFEAAQYYARKCDYDKAIQHYEASFASEENQKPRLIDALQAIEMIHEIRGDLPSAILAQKRILDCLKKEWNLRDEAILAENEQILDRLTKKASR